MSLSSLLISSGGKSIDSELDALFKTTPAPAFRQTATAIPTPGSSKDVGKKRKLGADKGFTGTPLKRSKHSPTKAEKEVAEPSKKSKSTPVVKEKKPSKKVVKGKGKSKEDEAVDQEEENSDLENAYLQTHKDAPKSDHEEEVDTEEPLVHESLQKGKKGSRSGPKAKFVPSDETPERRDQRTIFIGNLSVEVAQKKPLLKQLQRHILARLPTAKIESTRFRSIPFQAPTSKLPASDDEGESASKSKTPASTKQGRAHDRERASTWRERKEAEEDEEIVKNDEKKFLNPGQKKKIAFINQEFHSTADTANAYVVFAHPLPAENRPSNLPPPPPTMDPYEAAQLAAEKCDGTLFMERRIRVDLVNKKGFSSDTKATVSQGATDTDPKLSVFVGNLDFASKEEDLRVFFEGVVSTERGPPEVDSDEEDDDSVKKPNSWVTRVRIVRDKETQLGKGFAYVQFADRECVDEVLALDEVKLKFAKRKLRVQRCKTIPGSSMSTRQVTTDAKSNKPAIKSAPVPIIVPKGDPLLGEKLAHMAKDARKQYKSTDADRVARRLAKKKARIAMGNGGVKTQGKDRERVRKAPSMGKAAAPKKKESKGRVRSDKSLAKRNAKK